MQQNKGIGFNSQSAPLLFGQSAMEKFGVITIDNQNNKLIIKR